MQTLTKATGGCFLKENSEEAKTADTGGWGSGVGRLLNLSSLISHLPSPRKRQTQKEAEEKEKYKLEKQRS